MTIPTEPIGSIPRTPELLAAIAAHGDGATPALEAAYERAIRDTVEQFEATGSPVIIDGEQRKYHNFWTYPVHGSPNVAIPPGRLGTMDDCGSAPFGDDCSTTRETAFAKIRARVAGTALAARRLGVA